MLIFWVAHVAAALFFWPLLIVTILLHVLTKRKLEAIRAARGSHVPTHPFHLETCTTHGCGFNIPDEGDEPHCTVCRRRL